MPKSQSHPFRGFLDTISELERIRNRGRTGDPSGQESQARTHATAWVPTTDVFARGSDMVISLEIPGVPPDEIDISVIDGLLTVSGEREGFSDDQDVAGYVRERFYGTFRRSMILPDGVDQKQIGAAFDYGVVTITVPGAADAPTPTPHRIRIAGGDRR